MVIVTVILAWFTVREKAEEFVALVNRVKEERKMVG